MLRLLLLHGLSTISAQAYTDWIPGINQPKLLTFIQDIATLDFSVEYGSTELFKTHHFYGRKFGAAFAAADLAEDASTALQSQR